MKNNTPDLSFKEIASRGGKSTLKKYGRKHFRNISKLAVKARSQKADNK